jgi:ketosteroid isomerase-like protein
MWIASTVAAVALVQSPAQAVAADPSLVLREADRAFFRATRERGLEGWLANFAADAVVFPPTGEPRSGAAELRAYYSGIAFPPAGFLWEPDASGLATSGDLGWTSGRWGSDLGGETRWQGRYLSVWRKKEQGWEVVADSGGEPDVLRAFAGLSGAPIAQTREALGTVRASDGSLTAVWSNWTALDEDGREVAGKHLALWKRLADGRQELAAEIGFPQAR